VHSVGFVLFVALFAVWPEIAHFTNENGRGYGGCD